MKEESVQVRSRLAVDELLRLEYARAKDILLLASLCSRGNNYTSGYIEDTTARLKFREEWRIEKEAGILIENFSCNQRLVSDIANHVFLKGLEHSKENVHLQEYLCLGKWGNGEPLNVETLQLLLKHSRDYFTELLRYRIDPKSQFPPSCKRKPGNIVRTRCKNRALEAKREYAVRTIQRLWRGFKTRQYVFESKNADIIIKSFRKHKQRKLILYKIRKNIAGFFIKKWLLRWTYVAKIKRFYRQTLIKETKKYTSNLRQSVTEYGKERMRIECVSAVESQNSNLLEKWNACVIVQSFYRMLRGKYESTQLKNAIQTIYEKLLLPFIERKVKLVKSWEDSMKQLAIQQKQWKRMRSCFKPHSNEILQVLVWRANSLAEILDLEKIKRINKLECEKKFSEYGQNLERAVMNSKLDKDWLVHTVTEEGKQQYLNINTGRIETDNPNMKKLETLLRKQKQRAFEILNQHRIESDTLIDTITQNEQAFRLSKLEKVANTITSHDNK